MAVEVIDTLKPKNNGAFPIVEAEDVEVSEGLRLPEALGQKADQSDLEELESEVAGKANTADVATETANLQGQINQIVISSSAEAVVAPEVAAARVGADGTSYQTLKSRLDSEQAQQIQATDDINKRIATYKSSTSNLWMESDILRAIISGTVDEPKIVTYSTEKTIIFAKAKPNTNYIVSKTQGYNFRIFWTKEKPDNNVYIYDSHESNNARSLSILTGNDAEYVCAIVYGTTDTLTETEILRTVKIEEGSTNPTVYDYAETVNNLPQKVYTDLSVIMSNKGRGLLYSAHTEYATDLYNMTNYIPVKSGDIVSYSLAVGTSYTTGIFYDTSFAYVKTLDRGKGTDSPIINCFKAESDGYIRLVSSSENKSQWVSFNNSCFDILSKGIKNENDIKIKLGDIFPSGGYPSINTESKTFTLPNDTIIYSSKINNVNHRVIVSGARTCNYADISSSAMIFCWDIDNSDVIVVPYNSVDFINTIPIFSFKSGYNTGICTAPFLIDGKYYGKIDVTRYDAFGIYKNDNVKAVAHRGDDINAPENTLVAMKYAKDLGFEYVETDVRFTSDNVPVLLHDATIDRTSNGSGALSEMTLEEVSAYDFGSWFNEKFTGEKIPTYEKFLIVCRRLGLKPYVEIKSGTDADIEQLVNKTIASGMIRNCTFICYDVQKLRVVHQKYAKARLGLLVSPANWDTNIIQSLLSIKNDNEVFVDFDSINASVISDVVPSLAENDIGLEIATNGSYTIANANPYITGFTTDSQLVGKIMYDLWRYSL